MQDVKTSSRFFGLAVLLGFFSILQMFFVEIGWKRVPAKGIPNGECAFGCSGCSFSSFRDSKSVVRKCQVERNVEPKRVELSTMFNWHVTFMSPKQCFQKTKKPSKHGKKTGTFFFKKTSPFSTTFSTTRWGCFWGFSFPAPGIRWKVSNLLQGDPKPGRWLT